MGLIGRRTRNATLGDLHGSRRNNEQSDRPRSINNGRNKSHLKRRETSDANQMGVGSKSRNVVWRETCYEYTLINHGERDADGVAYMIFTGPSTIKLRLTIH